MKIAISSTFTAEPLEESLRFWSEKLGWQTTIAFAPYNQVFQQLLDPSSLLSTNEQGINVVLLRTEDWQRYETQTGPEALAGTVERNARELIEALRAALARSRSPYFLCVCPNSPAVRGNPHWLTLEERLRSELSGIERLHWLGEEQLAYYPVEKPFDAEGDRIAHLPYTREFFAALGTVIARKIHALEKAPYKVIVVDCDDTLWAGICGEVGPHGVEIDAGRKRLQEFLVRQHDAGMLLCLASKNNPEDVEEVFDCRSDMPLRRQHIVGARVNWRQKSESVRELASELNLGLDSFIFIDDNPLECEQMKLACPEVLTLELPAEPDKIPQFLEHVWAFDREKVTEEDRRRTRLYRENQARDHFRQQAPTLESFLRGLELKVEIEPLQAGELPRVAQLAERTNQFNSTTLRRSEAEIRRAWGAGEIECVTVRVSDRFGDYGLVGTITYRATPEALVVDSFLLSCRVLGRGVEHNMLRKLGEIARSREVARVDLRFIPSKKNRPVLDFLEVVAAPFKEEGENESWFRVPVPDAAELSEAQMLETAETARNAARMQPEGADPAAGRGRAPSERTQEIAAQLADSESIVRAIHGRREAAAAGGSGQLRNPLEEAVAETWREVLGISQISSEDDFFTLGGDSLPAVEVLLRLNRRFQISLTLEDLFNRRTVQALAAAIEAQLQGQHAGSGAPKLEAEAQGSKPQPSRLPAETAEAGEDGSAADLRGAVEGPEIRPRAQFSPCPLSFAQESWWFLSQWAPASPDLSSCVLRLKGKLDVAALKRALNEIVARHEALRTTFKASESGPVQVISPARISLELAVRDVIGSSEREREALAEAIIQEEGTKAFDLASDLMLRPTLLRLASDDHVLILIAHHIAFDAWSRDLLLRELETLYAAFHEGRSSPLPAGTLQYGDFAIWQRQLVDRGGLNPQLEFWRERLADIPTRIELPRSRSGAPAAQLSRGEQRSTILPPALLAALRELAQQEGVTLFMVLLAAFQTLVHRYSGQEDVVVGSPVDGRSHPQTKNLVGCFINVLLLRTDFSGNPRFRELLARVREVVLEARNHQELPLPKLVQELDPGRNLSQAPLFQVIFAFEKALSAPQMPGLEVSIRELDTRTALHDVSLFAAELPQGLRLKFECKKELFEPAAIERMLTHLSRLLEEIAADPDRPVDRLPILGALEYQQLTTGSGDLRVYPRSRCIHQWFEEQVERTPEKVAVIFEGQEISYAELNRRSNQLARYLKRMGVGPDVLVGLCLDRSVEMVVGILGILKAGGAYLPIDGSYPKERLSFMLADAAPPVVITQYELKELFSLYPGPLLALDADWVEIERESGENLDSEAGPDSLAYVIYTSGSTGRPKGCQVSHYNVVRLLEATAGWYHFNEHDVWTLFHSHAFDFSVWELWGALLYGGRLVVVPFLVSRSPEEFYRLLEREQVTVLNQTPSSFRQLIEAEERLDRTNQLALRYVIFGGEALEMQSLKPWFKRHGDQKPRLINMYGITETTVHVTYRPLSVADTSSGSVIGRPIPDLELYVLDRHLQPVPAGVPGEMYVGGAGVARGYLNRPELTQERFILHGFAANARTRLYKTGDLARRLDNGDIEYLGRIDQQVKIRGFRIELGEIEAVLSSHPGVREAVVIISEEQSVDKRLLAYWVPQKGLSPTSAQLHSYLKERLPEYMVPAAFVELEEIPLTANGKIDRRALPKAEMARAVAASEFIAPRTPLEEEVAAAWKQVLGLERISVNDNFFEIGGHSLLATRVIILLRVQLGVNLSLRLLFENPTVAGLASALVEVLSELTEEPELAEIVSEVEGLSDEVARQRSAAMREPAVSRHLTEAAHD